MDESAEDVEARIRALGQVRFTEDAHEEAEALARMLEDPAVRSSAELRPQRRYRRFFRGHRLVASGIIVLAGLGLAVPAAAIGSWLAHTGEYGDPSTSTEVDDTEWIDLGAPDAPQVVVEAYPDYLTLPKSVPPEAAIAHVSRIFDRLDKESGGQGIAQEGLMTQTYEFFAICAWTGEWLTAEGTADAPRMNEAASWLSDLENFPSVVAHDGGGVTDSLLNFAAAAHNGDAETVKQSYDMQTCDTQPGGRKR